MPIIRNDIQPSFRAEEIASDINNQFNITWVSPFLVQLFIALSQQVRLASYNYLMVVKNSLMVEKAKVVRNAQKGDAIANQLKQLQTATAAAFGALDAILAIVPIDSTLKVIPEVEDFLNLLTAAVPIKIPETALYGIAGVNGFELFEGVTDYRSLKAKIEEIEYRLSRAAALSNYAQAGSAYLDAQINKIDVYLEIIVTLNTDSI